MDPYLEQKLRDEVIYLHSLWHQGPPSSSSSSNPNPITNIPNPHHYHRQPPFSATNRQKRIRNNRRNETGTPPAKKKPSQPNSPAPPNSDPPWSSSPWPSTKPNSAPGAHPALPQEQARLAALKLQHTALDSCRGLFSGNAGSDSEEEDEDESGGVEDYWVESGESEEYKVLLNVFVEKSELRKYYEVNCENGEFCCLVCCGLGKKKWVKGCGGLVQHAVSISNTKMKRAHRAFAKVVCRVLGWDFHRLPTIVLKGERLGLLLEKPGVERGVSVAVEDNVAAADNAIEGNVAAANAVEDNVAADNDASTELGANEAFDDHLNKGEEVVICQNTFKDAATSIITENIDKGISETEANRDVMDNCEADQSLISRTETEWPCKEPKVPSLTELGWPTFSSPPSAPTTCSIPVEEQARSAAVLLQQKAIKECEDFFTHKDGSYSDEDNSEDEDEGDWMDEDEPQESEELKLFSKIFTEDGELRSFYEKNYEGGEFFCLVCGGLRKKAWKRFKGCVALLQHSTAILKTKKKVAHRAYGQVICKVLGWDIGQPPSIVSVVKPLDDGTLANSAKLQGDLEEKADDHKDNASVLKENLDFMSGHNGEIVSEASDVVHSQGTLKTCELQGELEENVEDHKDNFVVSNKKLDSMSGHSGELVSEESDVVQSNEASQTCEMQGELKENSGHKDNVVSTENEDSKSGHNEETVSKEESDVVQSIGTSEICVLQSEREENADDHKDNVVLKENVDSISDHNGEIISKAEFDDVENNGTTTTCELQSETEKHADGEDLKRFMESLEPL